MKKIKIILSLLLIPVFVSAVTIENPLGYETFEELIEAIISFITVVGVSLAPVFFIIAGFYYLTAGANPDNIQKAKNIFKWTVIGLAIILIARGVNWVIIDLFNVGG